MKRLFALTRMDFLVLFPIATVIAGGWIVWQDARHVRAMEQQRAERERVPVTDFFDVKSVFIPTHVVGDDPYISYNRVVMQPVVGSWVVDIRAVGEKKAAVCTGFGTSKYEPDEPLPDGGIKLSWYIGKKCDLPPGEYVAETEWELRPPGYPIKIAKNVSSVFRVLPMGSQLDVTPEQVMKLEASP